MHKVASPKQIDFLRALDSEREGFRPLELSQTLAGEHQASSAEASKWISTLLALPKRPKPAAAPAAGDALADALAAAKISMYAVPTSQLRMIPGLDLRDDLLFLEVRPWKGRNYLNRLHGAPGRFRRTRFNRSQQLALLAVIAGQHLEYARLFGEHYTCCGRCAAPLTDLRSRELFLGPTCAGHFGVKF